MPGKALEKPVPVKPEFVRVIYACIGMEEVRTFCGKRCERAPGVQV